MRIRMFIMLLMASLVTLTTNAQFSGGVNRPTKKQSTQTKTFQFPAKTTHHSGKKKVVAKKNTTETEEEFYEDEELEEYVEEPQPLGPKDIPQPVLQDQTVVVGDVAIKMIGVQGGVYTTMAFEEEIALQSFYISQTEVTQALWETVMGQNPSTFKGRNLPVESVSPDDCKLFLTKLKQMTGKDFRLLSDAEWEYAARGGNKSRGYYYSGSNVVDDVAWYIKDYNDYINGDNGDRQPYTSVATKRPNELGIYDMSGNVYEWCSLLSEDYDILREWANGDVDVPIDKWVVRGGSWRMTEEGIKFSLKRSRRTNASQETGLRLALSGPTPALSLNFETTSSTAYDDDDYVMTSNLFPESNSVNVREAKVNTYVEQMPVFPGGEAALQRFINDHLKYPQNSLEEGVQGTVMLRFVVNENGSVGDVQILKSLDTYCDREAKRVVQSLPRFTPGRQQGKPVKVWFQFPVRFEIEIEASEGSSV